METPSYNLSNDLGLLIPFAAFAGTWLVKQIGVFFSNLDGSNPVSKFLPFISVLLGIGLSALLNAIDSWILGNVVEDVRPIWGAFYGAAAVALNEMKKQSPKFSNKERINSILAILGISILSACSTVDRLDQSGFVDDVVKISITKVLDTYLSKIENDAVVDPVVVELYEAREYFKDAKAKGILHPADMPHSDNRIVNDCKAAYAESLGNHPATEATLNEVINAFE